MDLKTSKRRGASTRVLAAAWTLLLGLPPAALAQFPEGQVLYNCDAHSPVLQTISGSACHPVMREEASYLKLSPGTRALVFASSNCTGLEVLPLVGDANFCGLSYPSGIPVNDNVRSVLLAWTGVAMHTGVAVHEIRPRERPDDVCWRDSYGRGAGTIPTECPGGERDGILCYPNCGPGYTGVGPVCWQDCPHGFTDTGGHCLKPGPYGRGTGYAYVPLFEDRSTARRRCENDHGRGNCERSLEMYYPKCRAGFHPVGCCVCSPNCPARTTDIGVSCQKDSYTRTAGSAMQCAAHLESDAVGLCYERCRRGFNGVGPVCWGQCPARYPVDCGAACASSEQACLSGVTSQVTTPIEMVANIAGIVGTGGASAVARTGANVSKATIKSELQRRAREIGRELAESAAESAATTCYEAQLTGEFDWTSLDPTGIAAVVDAFYKPICEDFFQ